MKEGFFHRKKRNVKKVCSTSTTKQVIYPLNAFDAKLSFNTNIILSDNKGR